MRFREKDERGLHPTEAECPKGKTQIRTKLYFVDIVLSSRTRAFRLRRGTEPIFTPWALPRAFFGIAQRTKG